MSLVRLAGWCHVPPSVLPLVALVLLLVVIKEGNNLVSFLLIALCLVVVFIFLVVPLVHQDWL